ncbi:hypothetical protein CC86DRAFT_141899 [Ophiobolus disseminans]|uniref:C2H2-type domain-containing protein n=1 Tax=Ophiobolus disseminans TaxID=1469910 RepID=A0A6A7AEB1_9PLEO|nr:hypothetical protein CC86DRAFT_141899 [Ophiobolus disseminans]
MLAMSSHQFVDLPQINMEEPRYTGWGSEHYYMPSYKQQDVHFHSDDAMYFDELDHGTVSMPPMERFMHDQYPITHGVLHATFPVERRPYEQWPSADCYRNVSPDRTSASGSSNVTQNELRSPHIFRAMPYGSPTDAHSQSSLPYPTTEHFKACGYLPSPPHIGGSVNLRQLEYEHHELESEPTMEDIETVDLKEEAVCNREHTPVKIETATSESFREYADSGIGNSPRDAEEVTLIEDAPEDPASDSDYSPTSSRSGKRRRSSASIGSPNRISKRRTSVAKSSTTKAHKKARRTSNAARKHVETDDDRRPFPCPLAAYGCISTFSSKNEWKRHVNTQHIKVGFWRCDLCPPTTDPHDDQTFYYNDFNRKDLFTQHLRRMHAAPKDNSPSRSPKEFSVNEDNLPGHQTRCLQSLRTPPQQSICLFCDRTFEGPLSWEERMEHVGRHLEKDRKGSVDMLDIKAWNRDKDLERYLLNEGLVVEEQGVWKIGDGKPRRSADDSEDESSEE